MNNNMGGNNKKKALSSSDRTPSSSPSIESKSATEKNVDKKNIAPKQQQQKLSVLIEEPQAMRVLKNLRAITIQGFARTAGIKISVANSFIKSIEAKGLIKAVGGYSGHRVYELVKE